MSEDKDYEVGFGKPPKKNQFQKGQSGNPDGRPKGTRNLKTDLEEELAETVAIQENGRTRRLSKQRLVVKALVAKAAKGDARAQAQLLNLMLRVLGHSHEDRPAEPLSADEEDLLNVLAARALRQLGRASGEEDAPDE